MVYVKGGRMIELMKHSMSRRVFLYSVVASTVLIHPLFGDIEGDIELLKLIADGYEANIEKLRTWKGTAAIKRFHTAIPSTGWGERQWESQNEFLLDRDQDAIRWYGERLKGTRTLEGKTSALGKDRHSGMIKGKYDYRLTFPETEKGPRNLLIIPSGQWPRNFESDDVFDPVNILTKEIYPDVVGQLRMYHRLEVEGKWKSGGSITREGDIVTLAMDGEFAGYGKIVSRHVFDLAKGCCLREFFTSSSASESHWKLDYEKIAGVFVMKTVAYTYKDKREGLSYASTSEAVLTNEMVNERVDPAEFELDKLGLQPGDGVFDRVMGGVRYYWKKDLTPHEMLEQTGDTSAISMDNIQDANSSTATKQEQAESAQPTKPNEPADESINTLSTSRRPFLWIGVVIAAVAIVGIELSIRKRIYRTR
jgi:hypothetical protein